MSKEFDGWGAEPPAHARRLTGLCAAAACGIALLALAGWIVDARFLAGQWGGSVPMAPSTALAFLFLGSGSFSQARWPARRLSRHFALACAAISISIGVLVLAQFVAGFDSGVEGALARTDELFGRIPLGRMSPLTAASFLIESAALMLLLRAFRWRLAGATAALLALTATALNVVVLAGYFYGAPLLYGGATIPVALPTALAFVLVGAGQLSLTLDGAPALRAWSVDSMRGMLLRAFLPAMLFVILIESLLNILPPPVASVNPALRHSLTALLSFVLIVALAGWTARRTGNAIDRAQEALRESEEWHRTILQTAMDGFCLSNAQGHLLEVNETYCRMSGYSPRELLAMRIFGLGAVEADDDTAAHIQKIVARGEDRFETRHRRKDGSVFDVEVSAQYRPTDGGRIVAFLCDITERKRAEKAKLEAQLLQAHKMESIGRLAGGVAHDFNNLLTVINGYSELLLTKLSPDDPLRANLAEIHKAGERAAGLTRQLLAFSRKQVLQPRVLDLNHVVREMQSMLARMVGEDVEVSVALNAESGTLHADPHQLEQAIMNLVANARDAMPRGGKLLIETALVEMDGNYGQSDPEPRAGLYVMLAVSDSGVGMDEDTRLRIFEPFFTTKGVGQGTGLGLSMVQGIVERSGGYINVYSEPGRGTAFKIYLPALAEAAA